MMGVVGESDQEDEMQNTLAEQAIEDTCGWYSEGSVRKQEDEARELEEAA